MINDDRRKKLENIVRGIIIEGEEDNCTAARNNLCAGFRTSTTVKKDFESNAVIKKEQAELLKHWAVGKGLWLTGLPEECQFLTRGGEAEIYLVSGNKTVIKVNDAVYYATWLEFFNSIVIHNTLFEDTAYSFLGFTEQNNVLSAIVEQPFIASERNVDLVEIKIYLSHNGFEATRRNDYYNKEFGLILEDMHDENVIVNKDKLFFIDTVFYTVSPETN